MLSGVWPMHHPRAAKAATVGTGTPHVTRGHGPVLPRAGAAVEDKWGLGVEPGASREPSGA